MIDYDLLTTGRHNYHLLLVLFGDSELGKELAEVSCNLTGLVFLDGVATLVNYHHLELTLHLGDCELLVHPVRSCQQELLWVFIS